MVADQNKENLDKMYGEIILDHHRDPRHYGCVSHCDHKEEGFNPLCGDRVMLSVEWDDSAHKIKEVCFEGQGCSISMASSSIMVEEMNGKTFDQAQKLIADFRAMMQGELDPDKLEGDMQALSGVRKFPVRIKCALLAWTTLKNALDVKMGLKNV